MAGNNGTENNSAGEGDDITLKLKELYISETAEKYAGCEHATIEKFKRLTISNIEDIDEDLVESLKNVLYISRNERPHEITCISNNEFEKRLIIIVLLSKCEFPVKWNPVKAPPYNNPQLFMEKVIDKDEECEDTRQFKWVSFVLQLILVHELANINQFSEAYRKIRELQNILHTLKKENCKDSLYLTYYCALRHVVEATEAYILLKQNFLLKAKQVLKNIVPFNKMTKIQHAGILGLRAQMFMEYGFQSTKKCIETIKEAIKLDEFQAEWHFVLGKAIGRVRRFNCYKSVDREEINALEKALELDNNACYLVHLAQVYREHEYIVYLQSRDEKHTSIYREQMFQLLMASKKLVRKALELSPNCPHINIRCALGLLKIPHLYRTNYVMDILEKCIAVGIEKAPYNRMLHHVIGNYYTKVEVDTEKAERHLVIAARQNTYGASIDLIKLRYRQNKEFDVLKSLEAVLEQYTELERRCQTLAQIGSYYLFEKRDLVIAVEYYLKIMNEYPQCETMKMHKVLFLRMSFPVNVYCVVSTEINLWFSKNNNKNESKILKYFIVKASMIDENAIKESEKHKSSLVDKIIKESEKADETAAAANKLKDLTRKNIEKHIAKCKNKNCTQKTHKKVDKNEKNKSNYNKTETKKTNKKFINKRSVHSNKEHKGLKRSHSVSSIDSNHHTIPKYVWDICRTNKSDGSNNETSNTNRNPKKKHNHNDAKISNEKSWHKEYNTGSWRYNQGGRSRERFIHGNKERLCHNSDEEYNYKGKHAVTRGTSQNMTSVSTDRYTNAGNFFNENFDKRSFGSTSNLEQARSSRKRLDSASSEDSTFSYNAISAYKMKCHARSHSCDESTVPLSISCQGNRSRDSSVSHTELERELMSQLPSSYSLSLFNTNIDKRRFSSTSNLEQGGSYRKRLDSGSSGDSEFSYDSILSVYKQTRSNSCDESTMSLSVSHKGNRTRDSSAGSSELGRELSSQQLARNSGFSQDRRGRGTRGRGRGRCSIDKRGCMATGRSESVESLIGKIKKTNSFLPAFMQNK